MDLVLGTESASSEVTEYLRMDLDRLIRIRANPARGGMHGVSLIFVPKQIGWSGSKLKIYVTSGNMNSLVRVREQKATKTVWKCNEYLKKFIHVNQKAWSQCMSFMEQHVGLQQRCAELDSGDDEDSSWDYFHLEHVSEFKRVNSRVDETFQKKEAYLGPNVCTSDAASMKDEYHTPSDDQPIHHIWST